MVEKLGINFVRHLVYIERVGGSSPSTPTILRGLNYGLSPVFIA